MTTAAPTEPRDEYVDPFADLQAIIDGFDPLQRRVVLLRLAKDDNNGDQHFDHEWEHAYSWLCLRCAKEGRGGGNGWAGVANMLAHLPSSDTDEVTQ